MILDLERFLRLERPLWRELEAQLGRLERDPHRALGIDEVRRFHYLYQRASSDLAQVQSFSSEPELRRYLEGLVSRSYGETHETRRLPDRFSPRRFLAETFPRTFRRHLRAFALAAAVTLAGTVFGGLAVALDADAKPALIPFSHLEGDPSRRVAEEESASGDRLSGRKASFSSMLMTHNTRVAVFCLALGLTWGTGTLILLFYNGVILGAVAVDYIAAGQAPFLLGWLLPHGAIEIPAFVLAGQAGLVLASALIGWGGFAASSAQAGPLGSLGSRGIPAGRTASGGRPDPGAGETSAADGSAPPNPEALGVAARLRAAGPDLVVLIAGVGLMLIWAGFVEAFLSQYHEPVLPYALKIAFGAAELVGLVVYLGYVGREKRAR